MKTKTTPTMRPMSVLRIPLPRQNERYPVSAASPTKQKPLNPMNPTNIDCTIYEHGGSDYMPGVRAATALTPSLEMAWMAASLSQQPTDLPTTWGERGVIKCWGVDRNHTAVWSVYAAGYEWFCVFIPQGLEWGVDLIAHEIIGCAPYLVANPDAPFPMLRKYDAGEEAKRVSGDTKYHRLVTIMRPLTGEPQPCGDLSAWMSFAPQVCLGIAGFMATERTNAQASGGV